MVEKEEKSIVEGCIPRQMSSVRRDPGMWGVQLKHREGVEGYGKNEAWEYRQRLKKKAFRVQTSCWALWDHTETFKACIDEQGNVNTRGEKEQILASGRSL